MKTFVDGGERDALLQDVAVMREEVLRLDDAIKRFSSAPQVRCLQDRVSRLCSSAVSETCGI